MAAFSDKASGRCSPFLRQHLGDRARADARNGIVAARGTEQHRGRSYKARFAIEDIHAGVFLVDDNEVYA